MNIERLGVLVLLSALASPARVADAASKSPFTDDSLYPVVALTKTVTGVSHGAPIYVAATESAATWRPTPL